MDLDTAITFYHKLEVERSMKSEVTAFLFENINGSIAVIKVIIGLV